MPHAFATAALSRNPLLAGSALAVGAAAVVGVGSAWAPTLTLAAIVAFGLALLAVRNLTLGVLSLTLVSFFDRSTALGGAALSPPKLVGILVVLAWLWHAARPASQSPML